MFPSSAIQVIERTPWRLIILDPPYYLLGAAFLATCVIAFPIALFIGLKYDVIGKVLLWWALASIPFVIGGLGLCTGRTIISFSRESRSVTIARSYLGLRSGSQEFPLDQVDKAIVETARGGRSLVLLTRAGSPVVLTSVTDRAGYYETADAINQFLRLAPSQ